MIAKPIEERRFAGDSAPGPACQRDVCPASYRRIGPLSPDTSLPSPVPCAAGCGPGLDGKLGRAVRLHAQGVPLREAFRQAGLPNHQALLGAKAGLVESGAWGAMVELAVGALCRSSAAAPAEAPAGVSAEAPAGGTPDPAERPIFGGYV